ncbi:MAG: hypothetical protein AAB886_02470 [Patescibacteria group bacterium]
MSNDNKNPQSEERSIRGLLPVGQSELSRVALGAFVHFNPTFIRKAGWTPEWEWATMLVVGISRNEVPHLQAGGSVQLGLKGWVYRSITLFADGIFRDGDGMNQVRVNQPALEIPALALPLFSRSGHPLCPWCAKKAVYTHMVDWCPGRGRADHGRLPDPDEDRRIVKWRCISSPTWVTLGYIP